MFINLYLCSDAPKWVIKPQDFSGERGQNATLVCRIDGNPTPTYTWTRDGDYHTVNDGLLYFFSHYMQTKSYNVKNTYF